MGSTALQLVTSAYRAHNLNEVTSFSYSLEFPYNLAIDAINSVIREMNRMGNYWFVETQTVLTYTPGVYQYSFNALNIDSHRISRIRLEAPNFWTELKEKNYRTFRRQYRQSALNTTQPYAWSKYGDTFEFDAIPDQDYQITVSHFRDMPLIMGTTDTILVPGSDEDVVVDCIYQWLGYKIGKWDIGTAYSGMAIAIKPLLADMSQDAGLPHQMPAAF